MVGNFVEPIEAGSILDDIVSPGKSVVVNCRADVGDGSGQWSGIVSSVALYVRHHCINICNLAVDVSTS